MAYRYRRIKKVLTKTGKIQYFLGDGLFFGRIGKDEAELGLATGTFALWETKAPALRLVK